MVQPMRWTGSDRSLMDAGDVEQIAGEAAAEILNDEYDGYNARSFVLAAISAFNLCSLTESEQWYVHTDMSTDDDGRLYRVWVER